MTITGGCKLSADGLDHWRGQERCGHRWHAETCSVSATAADSDGSVSSAEWLVGGTVVATGNSVTSPVTVPI